MSQAIIQHLESCAQLILAPPECVTLEERNRAQQVFLDFQKTKCPFDLCRDILETCRVPFVLFQAGCCLKNGVIRDWSSLNEDQRKMLLSYLNEYVNAREMETFVREILLLVCAIILKRIAIDEGNDSPTLAHILSYLFETISNANDPVRTRIVGCASVMSLLNEYSSSTRASDYGLPWATHLRAKKKFENSHLKSIFRCVVEALVTHLRLPPESRNEDWIKLAIKLLHICDFILSWNFDIITIFSSQYAKHVDSIENPILQPSIDWKEVLIESNTIPIFFETHLHVRSIGDESLIHHSLQCLTQLSTLNGAIQCNADNRVKFITFMLDGVIGLANTMAETMSLQETVPLTSILNRICVRLQCRDQITGIKNETLNSFLEILARITCKLLYDSVNYDGAEQFEQYKLATDNILNSWVVIICTLERIQEGCNQDDLQRLKNEHNQPMIKLDALSVFTRPIFEAYTRIHLNQPEGLRPASVETDIEEIHEFEESDVILFYDQLNSIGHLARIDVAHTISCLTQIFTHRINQLQSCLQRDGVSSDKTQDWINLNEDLHWLIMISTWILTGDSSGEREMIPSQIMTFSIEAQADLSQTLIALQNCDPSLNSTKVDPVIKLIIVFFKICSIEKYLCESGNSEWISPQVSISLTMFISRFAASYLLPSESEYTEMSMTLNSCFGRDAAYANQTLNFIVDHIITKLIYWPSEFQVTDESSLSLVHFVKNCSERCKALNNCVNMNKLLEKHTRNELINLSITSRKNIYQVFVYIATYKPELYEQIFIPLRERYLDIKRGIESNQSDDRLRSAIVELCECLEGIASGTNAANVNTVWKTMIGSIFNDLSKLLIVFHNYNSVVNAILQLLAQLANRILCFLDDNDVLSFYNSSIDILNVYAKHNCGMLTREETEEESYSDILTILNFLNDLAAKDFIEWFPEPGTSENETSTSINATQVVFVGLNIIMPLMNAQLLEYPKLCQSYYKLIVFLCEDPERSLGMPDQLMESIMQSVQLALKSTYSNEVKGNCLTMVSVLGGYAMREPNKFPTILRLLEPFLKLIFEFTLFECGSSNDVTMRESVANALFSLICCFPSLYQDIASQLITQQKDENIQQQLKSTFEKLMDGLSLDSTRVHRSTFKRRFETFVIDIQGLLCIK